MKAVGFVAFPFPILIEVKKIRKKFNICRKYTFKLSKTLHAKRNFGGMQNCVKSKPQTLQKWGFFNSKPRIPINMKIV